jgi:nucleoside-diphosphate-sugar epimerase
MGCGSSVSQKHPPIKMRVFVTGAAGFIGRAVVQELLKNGHQVLGLARSDASAEAITKAGAEPHRGDLEDIESLKSGAKAADGVIHLAFIHDFNNFARAAAVDRAAIAAMGEVMAGTGKPLVIASGTMGVLKGKLATEDTEVDRNTPFSDRGLSADLVYRLSKEKQIRGSVIRLTPTVHGVEDKGFIPMLINLARQKGFVTYIGDGSARWPAVHRLDAAVLFRLALEKGTAGATYHAVAEQGVPIKDIMTVIGKHLQLPVEGKPLNEAVEAIGFFAHVVGSDNPTSSEKTQRELGWHPTQPKLLADMEANYFS